MSVGSRPDDLRRRNRASVLATVRRLKGASRTELAAATALSPSTISAITTDLIAEGVLAEVKAADPTANRRGRPQVALALAPDAAAVVAASLSLNRISASLIDYSGQLIDEEHDHPETQAMGGDALADALTGAIGRLLGRHKTDRPVLRMVVAVQGITDSAERRLLWSPITPADDVALAEAVEKRFGVPATVENDCNMMAEALRWRDPQRYRDNFLAILLSNGIGMGLVHKGRLFAGIKSSGGEFGHMIHRPDGALCRCGRRGCIEAYAGNYAIWRRAHRVPEDRAPEAEISGDEMRALAERARAAPGPEREAFHAAGEAIGFGLGNLFALIDPVPVALVGVGAEAFDLIEEGLRSALARTAGGQHGDGVPFDTIADELALMRLGCAMRALTSLDETVFAAGERQLERA